MHGYLWPHPRRFVALPLPHADMWVPNIISPRFSLKTQICAFFWLFFGPFDRFHFKRSEIPQICTATHDPTPPDLLLYPSRMLTCGSQTLSVPGLSVNLSNLGQQLGVFYCLSKILEKSPRLCQPIACFLGILQKNFIIMSCRFLQYLFGGVSRLKLAGLWPKLQSI